MDTPPSLFTGTHEIVYDDDTDDEATVLVVQDRPLPLCVVSIVPHVDTDEDV